MEEVLIRFRLIGVEAKALRELSASELRRPPDQARYLLREALIQRGLLNAPTLGLCQEPSRETDKGE